jgi:hypothetical protein
MGTMEKGPVCDEFQVPPGGGYVCQRCNHEYTEHKPTGERAKAPRPAPKDLRRAKLDSRALDALCGSLTTALNTASVLYRHGHFSQALDQIADTQVGLDTIRKIIEDGGREAYLAQAPK